MKLSEPSANACRGVFGLGVDIVEVEKIKRAAHRRGQRFFQRLYTPREIDYCDGKKARWEHYAARFAAKEAFFKALGLRGLKWGDVEIENDPSGKPVFKLSPRALEASEKIGAGPILVSLAHSRHCAVATVLALARA